MGNKRAPGIFTQIWLETYLITNPLDMLIYGLWYHQVYYNVVDYNIDIDRYAEHYATDIILE